jgi:VWFA-related protein
LNRNAHTARPTHRISGNDLSHGIGYRQGGFMSINRTAGIALLFTLLQASGVAAQKENPPAPAAPGAILLNIVVTPKSGAPVGNLEQQDFAILDNKAPQPITSFRAVDGRTAPIEVILVVDAVNTGYGDVAREREGMEKFLRTENGHLTHPTTFAVLTDKGMQVQDSFSEDGNALSTSLDQTTVSLRTITRSSGFYGATERLTLSLQGFQELIAHEGPKPGRKIILWVSPGWPILSGPEVQLDNKQEQQIYDQAVGFSREMRQGQFTLYSIDPLGTADIGFRTFYWESFAKGITKLNQAQFGDLALQVLATQSGGLALNSSNDIAAELQQSTADTGAYYQIAFDRPGSDQAHAYHRIEVRVDKPGLTARTIQGYYSQP